MNKEYIRLCSIPAVQEKIRENFGPVQGNDIQWWDDAWNIIRLPQVIDLQNPERGLWGMVDWVDWHLETLATGECYISANFSDKQYGFSATPELALLKALCYQWRIEVTP